MLENMLQFLSDIFDSNKPHPHAQFDHRKKEIIAFLIIGDNLNIQLPRFANRDTKLLSFYNQIKKKSFRENYPKYAKFLKISRLIEDCRVCFSYPSKVYLYWTKSAKKLGQAKWVEANQSSSPKFEWHLTYQEYYSSLPWILRTKVINLEKLSTEQLLERLFDLTK
jgi:hypothetical protein